MDLLESLGIAPPAAENAVCYEIYDQAFVYGGAEAQLEALRVRCMQLVWPYLEGYIWQHDAFTIQSSLQQLPPWVLKKRGKSKQQQQQQQQQQAQELPCLWGVVRYDDNVEDEWFIVWLLLELSRHLPGLCVRIWDDDGDFMLIEAAYSLPRWLKPETSTNRVWLRGGQLHIIPPPSAGAPTLPPQPTLREAVNILSSGNVGTHRPKVEAAVSARLSGYPSKAHQQRQRVLAWLPRRVGLLLQEDPQAIAAAAAAFMTRTREEVQAAAKHSHFPPQAMTTVLVTMNRCQYAQLMQADFTPPRGCPAPDHDHSWLCGDAARQDKATGMGAKIHTGMEIMCLRMGLSTTSSSSSSTAQGRSAATTEPAATSPEQQHQQQQQPQQQLSFNPAWHHYLTVLRQSGYFAGELEGSARYKQLMAAAQTAFRDSATYISSSKALAAPANHLQRLLSRIDLQQRYQQQQADPAAAAAAAGLKSSAAAVLDADGLSEDSDSWMEDEAAAVQQQLAAAEAQAAAHEARKQQRKAGAAAAYKDGPSSEQQQGLGNSSSNEAVMVDAEQLVAGFKGFVQHNAAGPEGAELPIQANTATGTSASGVDLNSDAFLSELMGVLGASDDGCNSSSSKKQQQQQDPDALLGQLQSLQQQLMRVLGDTSQPSAAAAAATAAAGGGLRGHQLGSDSSDDECDSSSTEGSSFYDSEGCEDETPEDEHYQDRQAVDSLCRSQPGAQVEPVQLPVPPPVSGVHMQQQKRESDNDEQQQQQQQQQWQLPPSFRGDALQEAWEVMTATDSDDEDNLSLGGSDDEQSESGTQSDTGHSDRQHDGDQTAAAGFYDAYSTALEAELAGTTLAQSFERVPAPAAAAGSSDRGTSAAAPAGPGVEGLAPLDVDLNLIKSLVASYTAQGGLPGPASNLAGLLGLQLPTEVVEEK